MPIRAPRFLELLVSFVILLLALVVSSAGSEPRTGTIEGRVVDGAGAPLPGAQVTARCVGLGRPRSVVSDERGEFRIAGLPEASCTLEGALAGLLPARGERLRVPRGARALLVLRLQLAPELQAQPLVVTTSGAERERVEAQLFVDGALESVRRFLQGAPAR